jgi:membrane protein YdbS with pleckstrin-like domain
MTRRSRDLPVASTVLGAVVLVIAVAAHAGVWYFISEHLGVSGVVASVVIALAVLKHLGWIGGTYALLRRSRAPNK